MTQRDHRAYLADMLIAARDARAIVEGLTYTEFTESNLHRRAAIQAVTVIGEAASQIRERLEETLPDMQWRECVGMRKQLVHGYFNVKLDRVWRTIHEDMPALIARLEPMLPEQGA